MECCDNQPDLPEQRRAKALELAQHMYIPGATSIEDVLKAATQFEGFLKGAGAANLSAVTELRPISAEEAENRMRNHKAPTRPARGYYGTDEEGRPSD